MPNRHSIWCLIIISLTVTSACKRKSFDEEKQELVGNCPHLKFFQSSGPMVDSYLLEARYLECQLLLDSSSLAYGTDEMKRVIEKRKKFTLVGFARCLRKSPGITSDRGDEGEDAPPESQTARLGACLHRVMVDSVKHPDLLFKPRFLTREEQQETTVKHLVRPPETVAPKENRLEQDQPRNPNAELASQVRAMSNALTGSNKVFGQGTEDLSNLLDGEDTEGEARDGGFGRQGDGRGGVSPETEIPVGQMQWDAICKFTQDELGDPRGPQDRAPAGEESVRLLSRECQRLAGKLRSVAHVNTTPDHLVTALFAGEKIPNPFGKDGRPTNEGFVGRGGDGVGGAGADGGLGIGGGGGSGWGGIGLSGGAGGNQFRIRGDRRTGISMREGAAQVTGKVDPNEVRAVIRAHRNEVHHCYQKGLLQNGKLAGNVRVVFVINPAGRAQECRVEENLAIAEVGNCICGRLQTWRFPQPEGGLAKVVYSWTLQPGG